MGRSLYQKTTEAQRQRAKAGILWCNVYAVVAENKDEEHRHRIKVIIPLLDETETHDEWIEQLGVFSGSRGYGDFAVPAIGSEVRLFGEFGQGENLSYLCTYNDTNLTPGDGDDESTRVFRAPGDMRFICRGDLFLEAGRILLKSAFGTIQISAAAGIVMDPADEGGDEL